MTDEEVAADRTEAEKKAALAEWRREFFGEQRRRGNAFRDAIFDSMEARGYTREKGWDTEKKSPIENDLPVRILDIRHEDAQFGLEAKLGGGERERLLTQIDNDRDAVEFGHTRVWVHNDLKRLRDREVLDALRELEEDYPNRFALVDASDPESVKSFADRFPQYQGLEEAFPEARAVFQHYDAEYDTRTAAGQDYTIQDARREYLQLKQAKDLAAVGQARPATEIGATEPLVDIHSQGVRTTPMAEVGVRAARARGKIINGKQINSPAVTSGPRLGGGLGRGGG